MWPKLTAIVLVSIVFADSGVQAQTTQAQRDCLQANAAGGKYVDCSTLPDGKGAKSASGEVSASPGAAAQAKADAIRTAGTKLSDVFRERQRKAARGLDSIRQARIDHEAQLQAEYEQQEADAGESRRQRQREEVAQEAARRKSLSDSEWEEIAREREREKSRLGEGGGGAMLGNPVDGDTSPAYPSSAFEEGSWSPWFYLQDKDGKEVLDIHIAYWTGGGGLPSNGPVDYPTAWAIRNRTTDRLRIRYQVKTRCAEVCAGGWSVMTVTLRPGGVSRVPSRRLLLASDGQLLSATISAETK